MNLEKFPHWMQALVGSVGGLGLFAVAFIDSSVFTFPVVNDLLVIHLAMEHPVRMPYYALMATLGSLGGCVFLYYLARKGGELAFHKHAGARAERIRGWVQHNGFLSVLVPALLPPPTPFKVFVLAAGVFEVPLRSFTAALLIARGIRYLGEGYLAVRYGAEASRYLAEHKVQISLLILVAVVAAYLLLRLVLPTGRAKS